MTQRRENIVSVCKESGVLKSMEYSEDQTASVGLRLCLFGAVEVTQNGLPLCRRTRTRTEMWLLALLALHRGREVSRSWLAGTFWPDSDEGQALNNLRRSLSELRAALGPDAHRIVSPSRSSLILDMAGAWCDVHVFDAAISRGGRRSLSEAVDLYRGPLLEHCKEEWARTERTVREQKYLDALEALAVYEIEVGQLDTAVEFLRRVIAIEPGRETAQRGLLAALGTSGKQAAMMQAFRAFRLYLHNELHSEPDPETTALFLRLRAAPRTAAPMLTAATSALPRGNMPKTRTRFYGREQEMDDLTRLLEEPGISLVTLTGAGGCGKTRLAIEIAHRLRQETGMPGWFVALADTGVPDLLFEAIREAMSLTPAADTDALTQIADALQGEPTLLILDNFDLLIENGGSLLLALMERIPTLTLLVTSRQPLTLACEQEFEVQPLPIPRRAAHPDRLLEFASVQLFVDRARARKRDFELTRQNAAAVAALCEKLDGIPLAIELAAGWAKLLTPHEMVAHMERRFDFLVSHRADLPLRHQTMRAALDASCGLLSEELQRFLAHLTIFRGGWTLQAAQAVAAEPLALQLLDLLKERSLIFIQEQDASEAGHRFTMLESLREYAAEHLDDDATAELARRHTDFFLALAQDAMTQLKGAEQTIWLRRLESEKENLRAALTWSLQHAPEKALQIALRLVTFWRMRSYFAEGRLWIERILARGVEAPEDRAHALNVGGQLATQQGDFTQAQAYLTEGLALYRRVGNPKGLSAALNNLGIVARNQGDFVAARAHYEESMQIDETLNDRWGVAASLNNLGNMATVEGNYRSARTLHERSLTIRRELGDQNGVAWSLGNLGNIARHLGDYAAADHLYNESLAVTRELGDKKGMLIGLCGLSGLAMHRQDVIIARMRLCEILQIVLELDDKHFACKTLGQCASFLSRLASQHGCAARLLAAATTLIETLSAPLDQQDQEEYDALIVHLRSSTTPSEFDLAWEVGKRMLWQEAVQYGLDQLSA